MRTWMPIAFAGFFLSVIMPIGVVSPGGHIRRGRVPRDRMPRGRMEGRTSLYFWALVAGLALTAIITSCGGGNSSTTTTITQGSNGTTPGSYSVSVYAFTESNVSDGSNAKADANVAIPLTVN
jgi:hypothetical protein